MQVEPLVSQLTSAQAMSTGITKGESNVSLGWAKVLPASCGPTVSWEGKEPKELPCVCVCGKVNYCSLVFIAHL